MTRPVFLSYAREDEDLADHLDTQLRLRGIPVWRDRRAMLWGAYNEDVVLDASNAAAASCCCSPMPL